MEQIYNEGRVVGLSAYEIFVRQCLEEQITEIPTEQQWLTSMIGVGSSLILQIPADTDAGVYEVELPEGSTLSAAGVIFANPFLGDCAWDTDVTGDPKWAKKVTSYGPLIKNESGSGNYPTSQNVPYGTYSDDTYRTEIREFLKIRDGIVYVKNATWRNAQSQPPQKDIDPNFGESTTVVRLYLSAPIKNAFNILFTGFHNKGILYLSGYAKASSGGSADIEHNNWVDGGMLGPELIPWANKIVFSVPNSAYNLLNYMTRTIPNNADYIPSQGVNLDGILILGSAIGGDVNANAFIDFNSINLGDYYTIHSSEFLGAPTIDEGVTDLYTQDSSDTCNEIVAWYPAMTNEKLYTEVTAATPSNTNFFPPALYGVHIYSEGVKTLIPLDTAAPGTVKGFKNITTAQNYRTLLPDNYSIFEGTFVNGEGVSTKYFKFISGSDSTKYPSTAVMDFAANLPIARIAIGDKETKVVSLMDATDNEYNRSGSSGIYSIGPTDTFGNYLNWDALLSSLKDNKALDVLGAKLRAFTVELDTYNNTGMDNVINYSGARCFALNPGTRDATYPYTKADTVWIGSEVETDGDGVRYLLLNYGESPASIKLGTNFIRFNNGLKLFISTTAPSTVGVPTGSIGIGW